ncbi:MAG TPA: S9 family peptidase [Bryobacteraceae bacterium]|jgi:dipeptidyl-peptidase-4|nr:S9 family peptidase [Bryobacteraceae bacterium]
MQRRLALLLPVAALSLFPSLSAGSDELTQRLARVFNSNALVSKRFGPARWIRDGAAFTTLEPSAQEAAARDIVEYDTAGGKRSVLVSAAQLTPKDTKKPLEIEDYRWDQGLNQLLVFTESKRTWRTNTRGDYWLFDRRSGGLKKLGGNAPPSSLMFAKFSPDGAAVAYVRANNLYVKDIATGAIRALTADGSDTLVNGASDWVYEEELNLRDAFRWSPDGKNIAFWQLDESGVELYTIINDTKSLYPELVKFPYPKAGTKNPSVRVGVVGVAGGSPRWMQIPGDPRENYLFRMEWADERNVLAAQLNRRQNLVTIYLASAADGTAKEIFRDRDDAWVYVPEGEGAARETQTFDWLKGRQGFLWQSERDGWRRVYSVSLSGGDPVPVTPAAADAMDLVAVDADGRWVYYTASPENATERYLYRSRIDRPGTTERVTAAGEHGTHQYDLSPDCRWAFHTYSAFDRPPVTDLVSLPEEKSVRVLESNDLLRSTAAGVDDPPVEFFQVPLASGIQADGWMLKPRNFDPAKKYPVLVYVYGEPADATVVNRWGGRTALFHRALAADGYLVVSFENRGTPAPKGRAWRKAVYGAVGVLSTQDQTEAVLAFAQQRPYADAGRIGVWGWSGGGSNTLNLMFRSPDVYRLGVAVAPVPDQKLYDTIYQERYMDEPANNVAGYRAGSAINFADGLRGKLLIVHGSGDDNVHFQGTERLVNRLIELGKPFDFMDYPNRSHGIFEGQGTSLHVYSLIARYIEEHLPAGGR